MRKTLFLMSSVALVATPVALSAQTANRGLSSRYVQEAQQQHPAVIQEFGGAETGQRGAYVEGVGRRVAAFSGVNPGSFRFTTLNSAVENAFANPGGYIYITRQLMALMDNEAELAFALGHEVGHVAANHAQARESYARRSSVLGVLGAILGSVVGGGLGGIILLIIALIFGINPGDLPGTGTDTSTAVNTASNRAANTGTSTTVSTAADASTNTGTTVSTATDTSTNTTVGTTADGTANTSTTTD